MKPKVMDNNFSNLNTGDTVTGLCFGLIGGGLHYINAGLHFASINIGQIHWEANFEAIFMAFFCGLGGVFGKHLFGLILKVFKRKKRS